MSLKTKVKVGNITNLSDARYCAGMGVDMLGFKINESDSKGVSTSKFKEIVNWISGPEFVLEFTELPVDRKELDEIGFIELQASRIYELNSLKRPLQTIITIDFKDWPLFKNDLLRHKPDITYLLATNASGLSTDSIKDYVEEMANNFSVLLGIEISMNNIDEYLTWPITGLALNGSEETSPGIKDYDHLASILEKLEIE